MPKLVYIGGYGHSGSTLLEYLLTASPKVLACGEIVSAARERLTKSACTCGERTSNCQVWGSFKASVSAHRSWSHQELLMALLQQAAQNYLVVIDSSKTAGRLASVPFTLKRKLSRDFMLVHIVRDPKGVCWSAFTKAERQGKRPNAALRCALTSWSWSMANLACELFGWLYPDQYVRLRYEDMVRSPREEVSALFNRILPGGGCEFEALGAARNRHQLFGNRVRSHVPELRDIREDRAWETAMPAGYRRLIDCLTWPLSSQFGYFRPGRRAPI